MRRRAVLSVIFIVVALLHYPTDNKVFADMRFQKVGIFSSPNPVGSGARAVGMGGAFIAIADDATAASWNPAGLIQLEKPEVSMVGAYFNQRWDFSSDINPEIDTGDVDDFNINYFSATYPFHFHKNMVVSINYQRLYEFEQRFSYAYDSSYSDDYVDYHVLSNTHFNQNGYVGALGLACAISVTPKLSFGATLNIWTDELLWRNGWEETYSDHSAETLNGSLTTTDIHMTDKYSEFRGWNVNFGLLWDINRYLSLGAVVKTPFKASIHHEFSYHTQTTGYSPTSISNSGDVELKMPLSYGLGLAWRISDRLSLDLDVYRTRWSKYILTDSQDNKLSPFDGRPQSDSDVKDTTQVRIGGEYLFIGQHTQVVVPVRGGIFYDPEPSHGTTRDFYGIAIGSGIVYKGFVFDVAYQLRWGRNVDTGNLIAYSSADITQHLVLGSVIVHF
ncbi:MAG: outer membrane protein transport protein [Desulfobacterales bacterium]|nr:outer membrane protein transport protein [Desulfobacterales bacterium]